MGGPLGGPLCRCGLPRRPVLNTDRQVVGRICEHCDRPCHEGRGCEWCAAADVRR